MWDQIGWFVFHLVCLPFWFHESDIIIFLTGVTNESNLKYMLENGFYRDMKGFDCSVVGCAGVLRF